MRPCASGKIWGHAKAWLAPRREPLIA
jgi:hypothetical protein